MLSRFVMLEMVKYKADLFALTLGLSTHILLLLSVIYIDMMICHFT